MPSKRINRNFTYSPELKLQAVHLYLSGQPCLSIAGQKNIQDPKRIYVWMKPYQENGEFAFIDQCGKQAIGCLKQTLYVLKHKLCVRFNSESHYMNMECIRIRKNKKYQIIKRAFYSLG